MIETGNEQPPPTPPPATPGPLRRLPRRAAPAVALFFLAPFVGEYLLGNLPAKEIVGILFLAPMYGGGAILVREVARRTGRGWPTILLLAWAYGVLEAGLLDQGLFNPHFQGLDTMTGALVPVVGVSANSFISFTVNHAVWSISVPIAIVETFVPDRRTSPWLGKPGLGVTAVVFALGSFAIFYGIWEEERFIASPGQRLGALALITAIVLTAFSIGRRSRDPIDRPAPRYPWRVGVVAFVAAWLYFLVPTNWLGAVLAVAVIAAAAVVFGRLSRRPGWGPEHRLALAAGALMAYASVSFLVTPPWATGGLAKYVGNVVLGLVAVTVLVFARRAVQRQSGAFG